MSPITVRLPIQVDIGCAIFNAVMTGGSLLLRLHHQYKYPSKLKWMSAMGFASILFGCLVCWGLINATTLWVYGNIHRWCDLNVKVNCSLYVLHRSCLYAFVVLRIQVVNRKEMISARTIRAGKWVVSVLCASLFIVAAVCPYGVEDENWVCTFEMNYTVLVVGFIFNLLICLGSSWLFTRPLWQILEKTNDVALQKTVKKEFIYLGTSILFNIITILTIALVNGGGGILGFDCAVSSFCLAMLMAPVKRNGKWKGEWEYTNRASVSRSCASTVSMAQKMPSGESMIEMLPTRQMSVEEKEQKATMKMEAEINSILSLPSSQLILTLDSNTSSNLRIDNFHGESLSKNANQSQNSPDTETPPDNVTPRHGNHESLSLVKLKVNPVALQNHRESISVVNLNSLANIYMNRGSSDETAWQENGRSTTVEESQDFGESQLGNTRPDTTFGYK